MTSANDEAVPCNLCGHEGGVVVADDRRTIRTPAGDFAFHVRQVCCDRCGLVYWTPRLTEDRLREYYEAVYRAPLQEARSDDARRDAIRGRLDFLRGYLTSGALLEVGAGEGFFLERAAEAGFEAVGIEPSREYSQLARAMAPRARVVQSFLDQYDAPASADVVCSFFVLEHSFDAVGFLERCHRVLKPGGWCFLEVPDVARYPEQTGDMLWHEHTYHFTRQTLSRLLARTGFVVEAFASPGPSYSFGMAVLARRLAQPDDRWDRALPDLGAREAAWQGFEGHAATVQAYRTALAAVLAPLLARVRRGDARLAVYGSGVFYDQLFEFAGLTPPDVAMIVDDNAAKWGTRTRQGLEIQAPTRLADSAIEIVIIGSDAFEAQLAGRARTLMPITAGGREIVLPHTRALTHLARTPAR